MKVSIITAFYKGNAYMADYKKMIRANQKNLESADELESVIINDSPEESVVLPEDGGDCNIWIYDQKQNGGIHAARVRGLSLCTGDYVIFLDQDDRLREDAVATFIATMKKFLWLLLLCQRTPFSFVDQPLYVHGYTAQNLSADAKKMDDSTYEFIHVLEEEKVMDPKDIRLLRRTISYKDKFRGGSAGAKAFSTLRNLDIFLPNLIFKWRSKTPYGFNRE